uniref:Zinc finger, CCHC-type, retrotransposon Gag domain protein n=1 Tax=Tanacetum cinerariifolium TaxID=118510 RepID=A0A6L2NSI7_TANCI|nr:hypothetical protein [Tanacetum cinerariifolium]
MEKIFDVMGCEDAFKTRLAVYKFEAAGTEEEQAKNFQWGLRKSTLNHLICMPFSDVAQVANAARNYEILHERDDDDAERPDKRQKSGDRHQPTTQQSSHKNHGIPVMGVTRETGVSSPTDLPILVYSSPGVLLRATPTRFALRVDADTQESVVELLAFMVLRDEVDIAKSALGQVNAMIAEIEAMDDSFKYPDSLGCLKDSKRILGWKIMGLNQMIEDTEGRSEPLKAIWTSWMQQSTQSRHMVW